MWIAAFMLGLAGSLHCIGMCGPLAMQITAQGNSRLIGHRLLYHAGRVGMYGILGILAGSIGQMIEINGWQGKLSIIVGVVLLITLVTTKLQSWFLPRIGKGVAAIKRHFTRYIKQKSALTSALMGAFNGLLPCGLVYTALAMASVQPTIETGVVVMILFGIGTIPALLTSTFIASRFLAVISFSKIQTAMIIIVSFTMIWRGFAVELSDPILQEVTLCQ